MKTTFPPSKRLALLALAFLVSTFTPATRAADSEKLTGPHQHENLAVYLIHGEDRVKGRSYLTLQDALAQKKVVVKETGKVNELVVENVSKDEDIYIQAGDIVKGGNQDRTLGTDLILGAKSKTPIAAFCVEQGRWKQRGKESNKQFAASNDYVASKALKLAVKQKKGQSEVWDKVAETQSKLSGKLGGSVASSQSVSSLQLTLEDKKVKASADSYITALSKAIESESGAIGFAFAINGKISSADVYGSRALFDKMWPKMLRAAAVEAVAELEKGKTFETPTPEQVKAAIEDAETGTAKEENVTQRVKSITKESKSNLLFETKDEESSVHRNYVVK